MPRNSSGAYTLPSGNPVVTGTTISITWANNTLNDLAAEMQDSLSRSGDGAMTVPILVPDGSAAAPGYAFSNDTDGGMYRVGANDVGLAAGGAQAAHFTSTTFTVTATLAVAGTATFAGAITSGLTITQSSSNTAGLTVTGNGSGDGVVGNGGATGDGGTFTGGGTSGNGAVGIGGPSGHGLFGTGGTNGNGVGGLGNGTGVGGSFANGTAATGAARKNAVALTNGDLTFSGVTNPNKDASFVNVLSLKHFAKAWARFTVSGGGGGGNFTVTHTDGVNITTIGRQSATLFRVTFAGAFADANYIALGHQRGSNVNVPVMSGGSETTTTCDFAIQTTATGAAIDLDATAGTFVCFLVFFGAQ